ncbi:hypothetical protein SASPL_104205 [Salvia splendens]|uniref:Uncharacterized protein n=1 Tax=Salvia splendens TaxID=180675 RepID=A0A8X8YJH3_SALSN|nr:hypothetical protein SASPL_104205 [Salvia splendens]
MGKIQPALHWRGYGFHQGAAPCSFTGSLSLLLIIHHIVQLLQWSEACFSQYEHPVVLTVEAQAKYVGNMKGALRQETEILYRFYFGGHRVLSQRLGLGKGGVRMAPEEALSEILHVPLGCVTPFALVNESARYISFFSGFMYVLQVFTASFWNKGFKSQECCFFDPLSNDMSIALNAHDLDKFLNSIGKTPAYVDLEATPTVGKDQPPDLASLVPSDALISADPPVTKESSKGLEKNHTSADKQPVIVAGAKPAKPSNASTKEKPSGTMNSSITYADPNKFVDEILEKTRTIVLSEIKEDENIEKYRELLATIVLNNISKQLGMELKNLAVSLKCPQYSYYTIFKNMAYTEGFKEGIHHQPKRM